MTICCAFSRGWQSSNVWTMETMNKEVDVMLCYAAGKRLHAAVTPRRLDGPFVVHFHMAGRVDQ